MIIGKKIFAEHNKPFIIGDISSNHKASLERIQKCVDIVYKLDSIKLDINKNE